VLNILREKLSDVGDEEGQTGLVSDRFQIEMMRMMHESQGSERITGGGFTGILKALSPGS
jgi:hypothetical protein